MAATKKPSGLTITRKGNKYIFKWKHGEKYADGQRLVWGYVQNGTKWESSVVKLGSSKKDYAASIPSTYTGISSVYFKVRGKADKKTWSDWTTETFKVKPPAAPKVSASWDSATPNKTTFSYEAKDADHAPYTKCEYQRILVQDCPENYKAASLWKTAARTDLNGTSGTFGTAAEVGLIGSNARVVRVRAIGPGGSSDWRYAHHVYAQPNAPYDVATEAVYDPTKGYFDTTVTWKLAAPKMQRPVDATAIQYMIGIPSANMGLPSGGSWADAGTPVNTSNNIWQGGIGTALQADECLFIRVQARHDNEHNESPYIIAARGTLAKPTSLSTTPDQGTHKIAVTATNNSQVPGAKLAVIYQDPETHEEGILAVGSSPLNVIVPAWTGTVGNVGVFAFVGTYAATTARADGVVVYTVNAEMISDTAWSGTAQAPTINVSKAGDETALITWDWPWDDATSCELSWADNPEAWESNEQPNTYNVKNLHASKWYIKGLEQGKIWYFRARLFTGEESEAIYGSYSSTKALDLTAAPAAPVIALSDEVLPAEGETTASWQFITEDGTMQESAIIAERTFSDSAYVYTVIGTVETQRNYVIKPEELGWSTGTQHDIVVKVFSTNNRESDWSDPVTVTVANPLTCTITQDSLVQTTETIDGTSIVYDALDTLPMTVTVTGAGTAGKTTVMIVRAEDYFMERPDETDYKGYEGQIIAQLSQSGEAQMTIERDDLNGGRLDDGAAYNLIASISDDLGQSAVVVKPFTVKWSHQAVAAAGTAVIAGDIAEITPTTPTDTPAGWTLDAGDTVDIYRLSAGKPELLYKGAEIGETYVDPYPTLGQMGGYRLVFVTVNGDYITGDDEPSWIDIPLALDSLFQFIDFGGYRLQLKYNVELELALAKTQTVTHYLGGSIQGDTLAGVEGSGSASGMIPYDMEPDEYKQLMRLGEYTGICHVRTNQGANYTALVNIQDGSGYNTPAHPHKAALQIVRVDNPSPDGVLLSDWEVSA